MTPQLVAIPPRPGGMSRQARGPGDPFSPPNWSLTHDDGTFANRFGDPRRGLVPATWRLKLQIGHTVLSPRLRFEEIGAAETMRHLRVRRFTDADPSPLTSNGTPRKSRGTRGFAIRPA